MGRGSLLRCCAAALALATAAVVGCSKEDTPAGIRVGEAVLVRLPGVSVAAPVEVVPGAWGASAGAAGTRGIVPQDAAPDGGFASADNAGELFSVTLGALPAEVAGPERAVASAATSGAGSGMDAAAGSAHSAVRADGPATAAAPAANDATGPAVAANHAPATAAGRAPATRADVELSNVWVFQFDAAGSAVRCEYVGGLGVGKLLEVHLNSGDGFTIGVVAGGPASGLSTETVPDLTTFREGLLFASPVASFEEVPYAGTLDGVRVLANGQVQVGDSGADIPVITLRRCMAQVTVDLTYNVTDYALDGVELYSVPVGAAFAPDRTAAVFPAAADANFGYRDNAAAGLPPHVQSADGGTGHSYTWYVGQNRRGSGTGIVTVQDKNASKAPAYATYARVKTHSTTTADAPLYYDIYLGEDMFADFNVTANHVYSYTTRIIGSAAAHYSLLDTDGRVSGKKPLYVASATVTPAGDIPGEGKAYSLTLLGLLPAEGVQVRAQSGGTALVTGKVTASGAAASLTVPGNLSYNTRTVTFEYLWNGTWTQIDDRTQEGWNVTAASVTPAGDIPGAGGTYTVTLTGWGGYKIRAISGSTELVVKNDYEEVPNYSASIVIPANTETTTREVTFQYSQAGVWKDIETRTQQVVKSKWEIYLNYKECDTRCAKLGGIPTRDEARKMDWSRWDVSYTFTYWTRDSAGSGSYYVCHALEQNDNVFINYQWDAVVGCRCMNE